MLKTQRPGENHGNAPRQPVCVHGDRMSGCRTSVRPARPSGALAVGRRLVAPLVFLVAYYQTYNKIPAFPPLGSTNKIFFVALAATLIGLASDLWMQPGVSRAVWRSIVLFMASLLISVWIGLPRFAEPGPGFAALLVALVLGGSVVLWRLAMLGTASPEGEGMDAAVLLAVLPTVFAPIALFGGSSTSVGLCLGLTAGLGMSALVNLFAPRRLV